MIGSTEAPATAAAAPAAPLRTVRRSIALMRAPWAPLGSGDRASCGRRTRTAHIASRMSHQRRVGRTGRPPRSPPRPARHHVGRRSGLERRRMRRAGVDGLWPWRPFPGRLRCGAVWLNVAPLGIVPNGAAAARKLAPFYYGFIKNAAVDAVVGPKALSGEAGSTAAPNHWTTAIQCLDIAVP